MNITKKSCVKSRKIKSLEAAIRRLPVNYAKIPPLELTLGKYKAGYKGEQTLDYYLSFLHAYNLRVFHGLRLVSKYGIAFQMDCLLLSTRVPILLEVKYITGIIKFDPTFNQMIRTLNGEREIFPNPITQVDLQRRRLIQWFADRKQPHIPHIETLVVFTNPKAILETDSNYYQAINKVIQCAELPAKIEDIYRRNKETYFTDKELNKIEKLLLKNHTPEEFNVLQKFNIPQSYIAKGIQCVICQSFKVKREGRKWVCAICGAKPKDAHFPALKEYALLYGPSITNSQLRDFLQLPSISIATKILTSMNLPYTGKCRNRVYYLPLD